MKSASAGLISFLAALDGKTPAWRCDLATLTLVDGTTHFHWTTSDTNILYDGNTYLAGGGGNAPILSRGSYKQSAQLTIDTFDLTLGGPFMIGGVALPALAIQGYFDGARLRIDHMIGTYPGDTSLGVIPKWFEGPISQPEPQGANIILRCKSQLELLNLLLPKFLLQPQCGNAIYDANCTLVKTAGAPGTWTLSGIVSTATITTVTVNGGLIAGKADNYFNLGVLKMTSGALSGQWRAVCDWDHGTSTITLALPFPVAPIADDTFDIYPGCDRSRDTCNLRYSNLVHYRGYPRIPRPESGGG